MANTNGFTKAVDLVEYQPAFISGAKTYSWDHKKITTNKKTRRKTEQVFSHSGLPVAVPTSEGQNFYFAEPAELPATPFTMQKYTIGWHMTYEMGIYERHIGNFAQKQGKAMGNSLAYAKDTALVSVFDNAFTSGTLYDGSYLCATHTTRSGDSVDNALTDAALSYDNVWDSINYFDISMINHEGMKFTSKAKYILTHGTNRKVLETILAADRVPDSSDWNKSVLPSIQPIYCNFLSSTTAYFVLGEDFMDDFWVFTVDAPKYDKDSDIIKHGTLYTGWEIFGYGVKDYFNIVGNPGL